MINSNYKFKWVRKSGHVSENGPRYELFIGNSKFPIARITHETKTILGVKYNIEKSERGLGMFKHSPYKTIKETKNYIERMYGLKKKNEIKG